MNGRLRKFWRPFFFFIMKKRISIEQQIPRILGAGLIWAVLELFFSKLLKNWQPALFSILMPFFIAIFIMLAKRFAPLKGSIMLMGIVAATIKLFHSGMVFHGPFIAILNEAFLAEIIFLIVGLRFVADALVGVSLEMYSAFHPLLTRGMFCNSIHLVKFKRMVASLIDIPQDTISKVTIISIYLMCHLLAGLLAAFIVKIILMQQRYKQN
ncbi:MAG: hypothetical protein J7L94_07235 [Caldisericaceae bacterium]|nr:hypothetical protein [Caldisericaceae bacterium]